MAYWKNGQDDLEIKQNTKNMSPSEKDIHFCFKANSCLFSEISSVLCKENDILNL